ncbi:MAG: hypothetical protein DME19_02760 [Verrucomicrobia bacterium]|nr:MAG: hypothetical protein DME19_02760 [Verrucomicrobiota bacterium]
MELMPFKNTSLFRPASHLESAEAWFTPGRFAALLAVFVFILFPDVVLGARSFVFRDFGLYGYPVAFYHRESFWRGEVPLWNPLNDCGVPFEAEWSTLTLYPLSFFYLLFPLSWSLGVFCLIHLLLAGSGMYFLAHRWTGNRLAASVAGAGFAFNGFTLSCLMWPHCMASVGWMPFVVWIVERAWQEGGRFVIAAAVIGTLQMLAGPPEVVLITWLVVGGLWLGDCVLGKLPVLGSLKRFLSVVLAITALSGAQLFSFFEFLVHSQRGTSFGTGEWSMPPTGWANLLVPLFYCLKTPAGPYMQHNQGMISSYYTGIGVLALALFALCRLRVWRVWLLGGIAGLSLVLALGDPGHLFGWIRRIFPPVGYMRYPIKFVIPAIFVFPLLSAFGAGEVLRRIQETNGKIPRLLAFIWSVFLVHILLILWVAHRYPVDQEPWSVTAENGLVRGVFLTLILGVLCAVAKVTRNPGRWLLGVSLLVLLWLDVVTHAPSQNPTVARAVYEPGLQPVQDLKPKPTLGESRAMPTFSADWRIHFTLLSEPFNTYLGCRLGLFADSNLLDSVPKVDGFYSLHVREELEARVTLYLSTNVVPGNYLVNEEFLSRGIYYISTNYFATNLADFMGVCQITAPGKLFDWEARPSYMPLLTAGQKPLFVEGSASLDALLAPAFNPRQMVYLPMTARSLITVSNQTDARIVSPQFSAHRVVFETEAGAPSMVVAAQTFYPCWKAYVDGQPARLWRPPDGTKWNCFIRMQDSFPAR